MPTTMKDIAEKAGVTRSAVSAVLNGTTASRVSPEKRELILRISSELNYRRNFAATALKRQTTGLIGFICGGLYSSYYSELTTAINEYAAKHGYRLLLTLMNCDNELDMNYFNRLISNMCDGILMCRELTNEKEWIQETVLKNHVPFVMLGSVMDKLPSVSFDYLAGMEKAFAELLSKGHRRVAFAGHAGDVNKLNAYRKCCIANKIEVLEYCIAHEHDLNSARDCGLRLGACREQQSALVCTDYCLNIMYPGIVESGLSIPRDLSVIAFNDTRQSRCFVPALTSVSLAPEITARYGMDVLLEQIKSDRSVPQMVKTVVIPPELIIRDSVASHALSTV